MKFTAKNGKTIEINPLNQASIDAAKALAPDEGIGPAVAGELLALINRGAITTDQLPSEYAHLGKPVLNKQRPKF